VELSDSEANASLKAAQRPPRTHPKAGQISCRRQLPFALADLSHEAPPKAGRPADGRIVCESRLRAANVQACLDVHGLRQAQQVQAAGEPSETVLQHSPPHRQQQSKQAAEPSQAAERRLSQADQQQRSLQANDLTISLAGWNSVEHLTHRDRRHQHLKNRAGIIESRKATHQTIVKALHRNQGGEPIATAEGTRRRGWPAAEEPQSVQPEEQGQHHLPRAK